jgi:SAM-dependent methyltransferase
MYFRSENENSPADGVQLLEETARQIIPDDPSLAEWFKTYADGQRWRIAFDIDYVQEYFKKSDQILEIGAVPLLLSGALRKLDFNVQALDHRPERFQSAAKRLGIPLVKCDIEAEELPFADSSFDGVVFNEVFEHMRINLIFTMSEILRVLRPGGLLLMSTPNLRCLDGMIGYLRRGRPCANSADLYTEYLKIQKLGHMGHVREYTAAEVSDFLQQIGFEVKGVIRRGGYHKPWKRVVIRLLPTFRPFMTIIAAKPAGHGRYRPKECVGPGAPRGLRSIFFQMNASPTKFKA